MPTIPTTLPIEITDKYSIVSNAFSLAKIVNPELDKYKSEPKDEINVEIGDTKQTEFYPQVKLCRWTNETNFSIRLKDTEYEKATVTTDKDKIIWDKDNVKIEFYDYAEGEGGYKMVWYLKSKPATNKVEFTIQSKGLDFFYQPPLTQEYQSGYSEEFQTEIVVTETQVKDLDGNVLVERPENVVGSYAVYHSTKGGMNDTYGKDYKVGKAFHIFRPHLIDAEGNEAWGNLHIENGIYSVEIPQDFLDNASFPLRSNDNFGYENLGATTLSAATQIITSLNTYTPTNSGEVTQMSIGCLNNDASATHNIQGGIYSGTDFITNSNTNNLTIPISGEKQFRNVDFPTNPDIVGSTAYYLASNQDNGLVAIAKDNTATNYQRKSPTDYGIWPDPISWTTVTSSREFSIYATYTPSGGGATGTETGRKLNMAIHLNNPAIA